MSSTDDAIVYAIKISSHGAALMCAAAGVTPPEQEDREWAEIDVQRQTRALTGRSLDEIISEEDIISRRPYRCTVCGGTFSVGQFDRLRDLNRRNGGPRPFDSGAPVHDDCSSQA